VIDIARSYVRGIAEPLPPRERVLWQGGPDRSNLVRHVFHARKVALYFGLLLAVRMAQPGRMTAALILLTLGVLAVGLSYLLGLLSARTSWYAITDQRVVMRTGIVLSGVLNVPLTCVDGALVHRYRDGTADLALVLRPDLRIPYLRLWPYARAWHVTRPQPSLRGLTDVELVGGILRSAVLRDVREPAPEALVAL
jgi:Bacterial PH domain